MGRKLYSVPMEVVVPADSLEEAKDAASHLITSCDVKYVLDQHHAQLHTAGEPEVLEDIEEEEDEEEGENVS